MYKRKSESFSFYKTAREEMVNRMNKVLLEMHMRELKSARTSVLARVVVFGSCIVSALVIIGYAIVAAMK